MHWFVPLAFGYLIGSIPFGVILTRLSGAGDLRSIGSGNIGATNVLRTGRKWLAAATLLLDLGKGLAAVLLARMWFPEFVEQAALGAFLGHCFPVWLKFRGGKGVATAAGICFGLAWQIGLAYALAWIAVLGLTRISSLAGIGAASAAPLAAWALGMPEWIKALAAIALSIIVLHRANIARLRAGDEPRVGSKS